METLQNHLQELASVTIDSEWLKDLVDLGSGAVKTVTGLTKAFGGLNTIIGAIAGILLQKSGFGLFSFDKLSGQWTSFIGKIKSSKSILQETKNGISNWMSAQGIDNDQLISSVVSADNPLGIKKQLDVLGINTGLRDYIANIDEAKRETMTFGEAVQGYFKSMSMGTKIISGLGKALGTFASMMGTMLISMAASAVLSKGLELLEYALHYRDHKISEGKDAQSRIDEINKEQKSREDFVDKNLNRYLELRKGTVNTSRGLSNKTLSTDEFAEFVSLNNQLAEQFPQLVSGYDSQGNALLTLSSNAESATNSLQSLLDKEKEISDFKISEELSSFAEGTLFSIETLQNDIEKLSNQKEEYQDAVDVINGIDTSNYIDEDGWLDFWMPTAEIGDKLPNKIAQAYKDTLTNMGYGIGDVINAGEVQEINGEIGVRWTINPQFDSKETQAEFESQLKKNFAELLGDDYSKDISEKIMDTDQQIKVDMKELQADWNNFVPSLLSTLNLYDGYKELGKYSFGEQLQQIISDEVYDLDLEQIINNKDLREKFIKNPRGFVRESILDPILDAVTDEEGNVQEDLANKLGELITPNGQMTMRDYVKHVNQLAEELVGKDIKAQQKLLVALDIQYETEDGVKWSKYDDYKELEKLTGIPLQDLRNGIKLNDVDRALELSQDGRFNFKVSDQRKETPVQQLENWLSKRTVKQEESTGLLSDIFNNEGFKDQTSTAESNITALQTALQSLQENAHLTGEEFTNLVSTVPDMAEFGDNLTLENVGDELWKNVGDYVKQFREFMDTMDLTDQQKQWGENYLQGYIKQFQDIPMSVEQAKKSIEDFFTAGINIPSNATEANDYVSKITDADNIFTALQKEFGEDFDANVVEMIMQLNPSMATADAEQWISTYNDYVVTLKLDADTALADAKIERLQKGQSLAEQRIQTKREQGELVTDEDYAPIYESYNGQKESLQDKLRTALLKRSHSKRTNNQIGVEKASAEILDIQSQIESVQADELTTQQSQAQERLDYLKSNLSVLEAVGQDLEQQRQTAEMNGETISRDLAKQIAINNTKQQNIQTAISEEAGKLSLMDTLFNPDQIAGFLSDVVSANEALSNLQGKTTTRGVQSESRLSSLQKEMQDIQDQASETNDLITVQQSKGLKANEQQYRKLARLSREQAKNLANQNAELRKGLSTARNRAEVEDQIRQNESSMAQALADAYGYDDQARNLLLTQAQDLSSAIQSAFSEMATPTGITPDTIKAISTAFSDLGSSADLAGVFYNTTDGVKANVVELKRLAQQEYELSNSDLTQRINDTTAAINRMENASGDINTAGISKLKQELADLQQQQSQVFAAYQQLMEQFSQHGQIALADQTVNQGANYDKAMNYLKEAKEMWDKGLIGTDDYKTRAAYFDEWGLSDPTRFKKNYDKFSKYMTDDIQGVHKFMMDLQSAGMATFETYEDGTQGLVMNFTDLAKAAHQFGAGEEWFRDMFGKAEEYGGMGAFVSSMEDAKLQTQEWTNELTNAQLKYAEMKREGASAEDLALQQDVIDTYKGQLNAVQTATENFQKGQRESYIKGFQDLKENIKDLGNLAKENPEGLDRFLKEAQSLADKYGVKIDGEFNIDEASYADAQKRIEESIKPAIDLKARPQVTSNDLRDAGWDVEGNGNGTVFTSSYSDETGQTVVMTPILPNGDVLEPESLEYYAQQVLEGKTGEVEGIDLSSLALRTYVGEDSVAQADRYSESLHRMQDAWYNNADMQKEMANALKDYSYEELQAIDYMDNAYSATDERATSAEKSVDSLMDKFELGGEYAHEFIDAMKDMGLLQGLSTYEEQAAESLDALGQSIGTATDKVEALFKGTKYEGATQFDAATMSVDELQNKLAEISEMKAQINVEEEGGQEALAQLEQLEAKTQQEYNVRVAIEQYLEDGGSLEELQQSMNDGTLDATLNIDTSDVETAEAMINSLDGKEISMPVKLDEGSLQGINEAVSAAINGEEYTKEVKLEATGQDEIQAQAEKPATKKVTIVEVIQKAKNAISGLFGGNKDQTQTKTETVTTTANTSQATGQISALTGLINKVKAAAQNIALNITTAGALSQVQAIQTAVDNIKSSASEPINIQANNEQAISSVEEVVSTVEDANPKITIGGDNSQAMSSIATAVSHANSSSGRITINGNNSGAISAINQAVASANGRTAKIKIDGDSSSAISAAQSAVSRIRAMIANISINAHVSATVTGTVVRPTRPTPSRPSGHTNTHINDATHYNTTKYSGTLSSIGRGYAKGTFDEDGKVAKSGTAYNMLNYKDMSGLARGDVAIDKDQESLVNELGTESLINFLSRYMVTYKRKSV